MIRYIDIDETVKTFEKLHGEESALLNCYNADWIVSFLESQPTADVADVVRCKDCKYLYQDGNIKVCKHWNCHSTTDDAYCSYGERRKEYAKIH